MATILNNDAARRWTDAELEALERNMRREYQQAAKEMRGKQAEWLEKFNREREQREKALDDTKEAMEAHKAWLRSQAARGDWLGGMVNELSESAHSANVRASDMVNDHIPHVFAGNANRAAFAIEGKVGRDMGFTLVNEDAVRHLMGLPLHGGGGGQLVKEVVDEAAKLGPGFAQSLRKREMNYPQDMRWNRQKFTSAITQGILQGESIPHIVERTESIFGQNMNAAIRAARTATTNAENAGRMSTFERAEKLGIDMEIEWQATLDERTRESHRQLDGQRIKLGEYFETENGTLRWPGDPLGPDEECWNCRCRADGRVVGFDGERGEWADDADGERWARLPEGMTYDEWRETKAVSRDLSYENDWTRVSGDWYAERAAETLSGAQANDFTGIAEGQDITGTWQRRPEQYDFEIEDVMAAQGFDGKPRIVGADEFDRAVKQANGGDGLIMQRTYVAPDRATLDAYREMLYDGKWYVDCSAGGAQYGQGMYCAADYTGKLSDGIRAEMEHYSKLNSDRIRSANPVTKKSVTIEDMRATASGALDDPTLIDGHELFMRMKREGINPPQLDKADRAAYKAMRNDGRWERLQDMHDEAYTAMQRQGAPYYVETMTLDPSARIATYKELRKGAKAWGKQRAQAEFDAAIETMLGPIPEGERLLVRRYLVAYSRVKTGLTADEIAAADALEKASPSVAEAARKRYNDLKDEANRLNDVRKHLERGADVGSYAAAMGYDAINAVNHGAAGSYTVILNRTKLIIRRPE